MKREVAIDHRFGQIYGRWELDGVVTGLVQQRKMSSKYPY